MVSLTESSLICSDLLRAQPRERGTILATKAETTVPALFPLQASMDTQRLQGESLSFTASLHPPNQSNQQYSILSLSDSSGAVVERVAYKPMANRRSPMRLGGRCLPAPKPPATPAPVANGTYPFNFITSGQGG